MTVLIVSLPEAMDSCVATWKDLFKLANRELTAITGNGEISRKTKGKTQKNALKYNVSSLSLEIGAALDAALSEPECGILLLPSVWSLDPLRLKPAEAGKIASFVTAAHDAGWIIGSVCGGNFYVALAGLLDSLRATTHWSLIPEFAKAFPRVRLVPDEMVIDNGRIILGGGITAYFDVGLHILSRLEGPEFSRHCANILIVDPVRPRQWIYSERSEALDPDIIRAEAWLEGNFTEALTIAEWAGAVGLEERTLNRRFRKVRNISPHGYVQKRRILKARELLERTAANWDSVTSSCGYVDSASFRKLFKKETGLTPKNYRDRFSMNDQGGKKWTDRTGAAFGPE